MALVATPIGNTTIAAPIDGFGAPTLTLFTDDDKISCTKLWRRPKSRHSGASNAHESARRGTPSRARHFLNQFEVLSLTLETPGHSESGGMCIQIIELFGVEQKIGLSSYAL